MDIEQLDSTPLKRAKEISDDHPSEIVALYSFDNRCRFASPSHETILGYSPAEMIGKKWTELVAPEDHAHASLAGDDALLHGESINFGIRARTKTGERVPLRGSAKILTDPETGVGFLLFRAAVVPV